MKRLNTTLGYYTPAFFHIAVETNIDFKKFTKEDFSIYLHEYIHFIQDVTTTYGLNNMFVYSEYIRYATNKIYKMPINFKIPVLPTPENEGNVYLNQIIRRLTNGDDFEIKKISGIVSVEIIDDDTGVEYEGLDTIESVMVVVKDFVGEEYTLIFGAIAVMESMAYLMEQYVIPIQIPSPDFPYSSATLIVDKIYPDFGKEKLNILALCDVSLMLSSPGKVFVQFLQEMKSKCWLPSKPEDIYDEVLQRKISLNGKGEISIKENYEELAHYVKQQVKGYFNDDQMKDIRDWVDFIVDEGVKVRFGDRYFILNIARGGVITTNEDFKELQETFGAPLISNKNGDCTFKYPKMPDGVEIFWFSATGEVIECLETGKLECKLQHICTFNKNNVDKRCKQNPWLRSSDIRLCPYAMMIVHWKLKGYIPENRIK